jgi:hypothetical protein
LPYNTVVVGDKEAAIAGATTTSPMTAAGSMSVLMRWRFSENSPTIAGSARLATQDFVHVVQN